MPVPPALDELDNRFRERDPVPKKVVREFFSDCICADPVAHNGVEFRSAGALKHSEHRKRLSKRDFSAIDPDSHGWRKRAVQARNGQVVPAPCRGEGSWNV